MIFVLLACPKLGSPHILKLLSLRNTAHGRLKTLSLFLFAIGAHNGMGGGFKNHTLQTPSVKEFQLKGV